MIMMEQRKKISMDTPDDNETNPIEKEEEGSWRPWLVSLGLDVMSSVARHMQPMSLLEKEESKRREYLFVYYLFRGPIYLKYTR